MKKKIIFFIILLCIPFTVHGKMMKNWWEGAYDKNPFSGNDCYSDAEIYNRLTDVCGYEVKKTTKNKKTTYDFKNMKRKDLIYNKVYQRCLTTIPVGDVTDPDDMKKYSKNRKKCEGFITDCKNDVMKHYKDNCKNQNYTEEEAEEATKSCQERVYEREFSYQTSGGTQTFTCKQFLNNVGCSSHPADCQKCKDELNACTQTVEENTPDSDKDGTYQDKPLFDIEINKAPGCVIMGSGLNNLLGDIYKWVRGAAAALVIVLGVLDFLKAVTSEDAEAMRKAGSTFTKRLILLVVLILLPYLIDFVLELLFGSNFESCLDPFK